jgi:hypothetical protein
VVDVGVVVTTADPGGAGVTTAAGGGGGGAVLVVLEYEIQPEAHVTAASAIPSHRSFIASSLTSSSQLQSFGNGTWPNRFQISSLTLQSKFCRPGEFFCSGNKFGPRLVGTLTLDLRHSASESEQALGVAKITAPRLAQAYTPSRRRRSARRLGPYESIFRTGQSAPTHERGSGRNTGWAASLAAQDGSG